MHDGEIGKFTYERKLSPNPKFYPKMRQVLAGIVLPELEEETVVFEGRCFSFYHQGCRYEAVVRGTASTFKRLGGIDKVADAFYSTIRFPDANQDQQRKAESDLKALAAEKVTFIEAFDDKPTVIDVLRYKDLLEVREVILDLQRYPKQLAIEDVLKRNYFNLRQKAQQELEFAMDIIDENYGKTDPREGIAQLERIDTFLGDYPPSTLTPGNANYPEWGLYYEAVRKTSTYKQR
jgi:hypothetical protein